MNVIYRGSVRNALVALGLVFAGVHATHAQVGSGWKAYSPSYYIQIETHGKYTNHPPGNHYKEAGASYDKVNGVETFKLFNNDASNRVEFRSRDEYSSGQRQFAGDVRVSSPTNDESVFQTFHVMILRAFAKNSGSLDWEQDLNSSQQVATGVYGKYVHVNAIHDANGNTISLYINGSKKGTKKNPDEKIYMKYGCYGTLRTPTAKVEWKNVKFYRK